MAKYQKRQMKKAPARKRRAPVRKPTFDKRVKAVISRMAENKIANFRAARTLRGYSVLDYSVTIVPCTPFTSFLSIPQGVAQDERVGNSIRVKKLKLSGVLRTLPYNLTTNVNPCPVYVKLLFMTRKDSPMEIVSDLGDLLQLGSASESPSTALTSLMRPFNKDEWTVHTTRTYKLGNSVYEGTSQSLMDQSYANNDFRFNQFVSVDLTKYCVKNIKFDDNTVNPSTRNIVMYPLVFRADNIAMTSTEEQVAFDYNLDFEFEDM